jgi:hydrogenase maturation protease
MKKILILGYGNPGRQDDGLGVLLCERLETWISEKNFLNITTDSNYQLNIEDAYGLNEYDLVIFVDATTENISNYDFAPLNASVHPGFTMHSVSPGFVMGLCKEIYEKGPESFIFSIKGYEWNFMSALSGKAEKNLSDAFQFITSYLESNQC